MILSLRIESLGIGHENLKEINNGETLASFLLSHYSILERNRANSVISDQSVGVIFRKWADCLMFELEKKYASAEQYSSQQYTTLKRYTNLPQKKHVRV
jgi:hypothetical protein